MIPPGASPIAVRSLCPAKGRRIRWGVEKTVPTSGEASVDPALAASHTRPAIAQRLSAQPRGGYLRDWVLGGIDGAVTTFAIVAGVAGAGLSPRVVLTLGIASLLADAFSMAVGNASGVRAEADERERLRQEELRHIRLLPEGEREEVRQLLSARGFEGELLERAVEVITSDRERWVSFMLSEEHGVPPVTLRARMTGIVTFAAFAVCGFVPLVPYALGLEIAFPVAAVATGLVFFAIGALRSRWSSRSFLSTGIETFIVGTIAASVAFGVGSLLGAG